MLGPLSNYFFFFGGGGGGGLVPLAPPLPTSQRYCGHESSTFSTPYLAVMVSFWLANIQKKCFEQPDSDG